MLVYFFTNLDQNWRCVGGGGGGVNLASSNVYMEITSWKVARKIFIHKLRSLGKRTGERMERLSFLMRFNE